MEPDWSAEERVPIRRMLTLADFFSLGNAFLGLLALISASQGAEYAQTTFTLILVAILFDGLDGAMSRLGHGGGRLGGKLDTLADTVTFVVAPSFLFYTTFSEKLPLGLGPGIPQIGGPLLVLAASVAYFASGILRLARFDYLKGGDRHDYFIGVTTPSAAGILACLALMDAQVVPALLTILALAFLMTSRIRLPKLRGPMAPAAALLILAGVLLGPHYNDSGAVLLIGAFIVYLLLGPGYVRRHAEPDEAPFTL